MKNFGLIVLTAALLLCLTACGGISKSVDLKYGETYKIEDEKLADKENLTWESENDDIASVSSDGTVTAEGPGTAKVTIKSGDKSLGTYTFKVTTVPIEQIIFSADPIKVTEGETVNIKYVLLPQDASDYGISWMIADTSIAQLKDDNDPKITGRKEGNTILVATTENGLTTQCAIEVSSQSAYDKLSAKEKEFVNVILPIVKTFRNPSSVQFITVDKSDSGSYLFEVSAQNGFGGSTSSSYLYDKSSGHLMDWDLPIRKNGMRANLITQAVHEKLGY